MSGKSSRIGHVYDLTSDAYLILQLIHRPVGWLDALLRSLAKRARELLPGVEDLLYLHLYSRAAGAAV